MLTTHNTTKPLRIAAILLAAGNGSRARQTEREDQTPKQYRPLINGKTAVEMTLEALLTHPLISRVQCVISTSTHEMLDQVTSNLSKQSKLSSLIEEKLLPPTTGGTSRAASVQKGCSALTQLINNDFIEEPDLILIHDSARPFVTHKLIDELIAPLVNSDTLSGTIPALNVKNTIKKIDIKQNVKKTHKRDLLREIQTPQLFKWPLFSQTIALKNDAELETLTDDASVLEGHQNLIIRCIEGDENNFKLTTPIDFERATQILRSTHTTHHPHNQNQKEATMQVRIATGFDIHAFDETTTNHTAHHTIMLGGVSVPCEKLLLAHSDGDVILHALTDAILGSLSMGDIGTHFPPTDPQWKNAPSRMFVEFATKALKERGAQIINADITILAEIPKIAPQRDAIITQIAALLGIPKTRIGLKATTMEGLGAIGKKQGLAAQVALALQFPSDDE